MKRALSVEAKNPFKLQKLQPLKIDQSKPLKFVSYNVASLNACIKKGLLEYIATADPDVLFIQETKLSLEPKTFLLPREQYPFQYYHHATSKKGYSGVLVCAKTKPKNVQFGLNTPILDNEGQLDLP